MSCTLTPRMSACPPQLSETQLDEFRECFNAFDKDGGGSIDSTELGALACTPVSRGHGKSAIALSVLATLPEHVPLLCSCLPAPEALMNSLGQEPSPAELEKMVELADADGSGDIDFVEFVTLIAHKMHGGENEDGSDDKLKKAFAIFVRATQSRRFAHPSAAQSRRLAQPSAQPLPIAPAAHRFEEGGTDPRAPLRAPPPACSSPACASRCVRLLTGHRRLGPDRRR